MNPNVAAVYSWRAIKLEEFTSPTHRAELWKAQGNRESDHLPFVLYLFRTGAGEPYMAFACEEVSRKPGEFKVCLRCHNERFSSGGEFRYPYVHPRVPFSQPWNQIKSDFLEYVTRQLQDTTGLQLLDNEVATDERQETPLGANVSTKTKVSYWSRLRRMFSRSKNPPA